MIESWRWFGPNDPVCIEDIMQTGVTDIVTALHHIPNGQVWSIDEIKKRQSEVENSSKLGKTNLIWSVVESIPVHEDIKKGKVTRDKYIENYCQSILNLAKCGIKLVIYNFMPILDWTRTDLSKQTTTGAKTLSFNEVAFAAFDIHILKRKDANKDYKPEIVSQAKAYFENMTQNEVETLTKNIIAGLPGAEESFSLEQFQIALDEYKNIDKAKLRENLVYFLERVIPVAEEVGAKLAIHPDDPPFELFGLPRIISTIEDYDWLFKAIPSMANGITFCAGSLGSRWDNDLPLMAKKIGRRIYFTHLRNVSLDQCSRSFCEAEHLCGNTDMYALIKEILKIERDSNPIYMRPDHGQQMLSDLDKKTNPGYSCIGRMKGLAEVRGVAYAVKKELENEK
ncbi:mannonate dehydratase [Allofrancisella guangzhouensis]|uniref:Mannonate dehydratase n=1 Tax=Allofrancisella guangzhouensis TaxID=594679 RepID=A0A0A8E697_9GAMM|nr:mannonate dehydratase [Allofrancisella guangzhouensis]AJC49077.1 mannonate dehydratase [Allofrancisella guangzhouensis]MBK2026906.1 mannonate dehydratase [Allofrancisella guangzhouensis]MBK2044371.1 mannonate dehydratase [Allofrancisella guangzhouensis]MBK2046273.1 mannonate dehydratase [Allofrancisella guangzhouensis]